MRRTGSTQVAMVVSGVAIAVVGRATLIVIRVPTAVITTVGTTVKRVLVVAVVGVVAGAVTSTAGIVIAAATAGVAIAIVVVGEPNVEVAVDAVGVTTVIVAVRVVGGGGAGVEGIVDAGAEEQGAETCEEEGEVALHGFWTAWDDTLFGGKMRLEGGLGQLEMAKYSLSQAPDDPSEL